MFVPRENPRSLFIWQPEPSPVAAVKSTPDIRELATPVQNDGESPSIPLFGKLPVSFVR